MAFKVPSPLSFYVVFLLTFDSKFPTFEKSQYFSN